VRRRRIEDLPLGTTHIIRKGAFAYLERSGRGEFRRGTAARSLKTPIRGAPGYEILEGTGFTRYGPPRARIHGLPAGTRVGIPGSRGVRRINNRSNENRD